MTFFGHPRGLGFLAGTELWERFSFYGMQALLMLYMTKHLLAPSVAGHVVGLKAFREITSSVLGPMTDLAFAAQTFGLYSGLMLVTPLVGAWLGDRVLGRTRTISLGALLMSAGHLTMASEQAFLLALLLLIVGGGCLVGNLPAQIGRLYAPEDTRRTRAFGVYLMAVNVGAFAAPLVVGTLGEKVGWHWGFAAAGVGMLVGLVVYLVGRPHYPTDYQRPGARPERLSQRQWTAIGGLLLLLLPKLFAFAAAQQAYGIMIVWAERGVDRSVFGWTMPVTWILTADGFLTIAGVAFANRLWGRMAQRGREPADLRKVGIGHLLVTVAFVMIGALAALKSVPMPAWLAFYLILGFSYAWWDVPTRSLLSRYAPAQVNGTMFAISSLFGAVGYFLLGYMGRFYEPLGASYYFLLISLLPITGAVMLLAFSEPLMRLLLAGEQADVIGSPVDAIPVTG